MAPSNDPIGLFIRRLRAARKGQAENLSDAMTLSTVGRGGRPRSRVVLLRGVDRRGFLFFTNLRSAKAREIRGADEVALCFHWPHLEEQVRVEGRAEPVADAEADAYFATRPRESQIGAWATDQSAVLESRGELLRRFASSKKRFGSGPVPRPPHWSGFRVVPASIEFWRGMPHRLHDRRLWTRSGSRWKCVVLAP
jgi:pyridoxamine 5'-phosphate oxidase